MGFTRDGVGLYRVLALPAARLGAACALGVLAVCLFAGAVRVLPLLLGPGIPLALAWPLARAALFVSLEMALFVAPPLAWALSSASLVERGEARALFALGVRPLRIVASAWPSLALLAVLAGLASLLWGREAAAPGRLARDLVAEVRAACHPGAEVAAAYDVPSLGLSWVCFPGEAPRIVGPAPFGGGAAVLSARGVELPDDLRSVELEDASLSFSPESAGALAGARLRVGRARVRGLPPLGRASNLSALTRTSLMALSAALFASLAALLVLARGVSGRALALAVGLAGPASALMVFSTLERSPSPPLAYVSVPLAGAAGVGVAFVGLWIASARARQRAS
jgi:hypothetical protein